MSGDTVFEAVIEQPGTEQQEAAEEPAAEGEAAEQPQPAEEGEPAVEGEGEPATTENEDAEEAGEPAVTEEATPVLPFAEGEAASEQSASMLPFSNSFTVTYSADPSTSGSAPAAAEYESIVSLVSIYGPTPYALVPIKDNTGNLERTGYTFKGWSETKGTLWGVEECLVPGVTRLILSDRTLYPVWEPNSQSVTFVTNGTTDRPTIPASIATTAAQTGTNIVDVVGYTTSITRVGYTFDGWYMTPGFEAGTKVSATMPVPPGAVTLYAKWTPRKDTISYALGASGTNAASNPADYTAEDLPIALAPPARDGYAFAGWTATATGFGRITLTGTDKNIIPQGVYGSITLTAEWTAKQYTLTYDKNAADATDGAITSQTVTYGQPVSLSAGTTPSRPGYLLAGWSKTPGGSVDFIGGLAYTWAANKTVYAVWNSNDLSVGARSGYKIERYLAYPYENNGAGVVVLYDTANMSGPRGTVVQANDWAYTYHKGFTLDENYPGSRLSGTIAADDSLILKAYYVCNQHTVSYKITGTVFPVGAPAVPDAQAVFYHRVEEVPELTLAGYTFSGWTSTDLTGAVNEPGSWTLAGKRFIMPDKDVVLTGSWKPNSYTVTFDANGGTLLGAQHSYAVTYGVPVGNLGFYFSISPNVSRSGYKLKGWATERDAKTPNFFASTLYDVVGNSTVYAVWEPDVYTPYSVVWYRDANSQGVHAYEMIGSVTLHAPTDSLVRVPSLFEAWDPYCPAGYMLAAKNCGDFVRIAGDGSTQINLFYFALEYAVAYDLNGGNSAGSTTIAQRSAYWTNVGLTPTDAPRRAGYTFAGWQTPEGVAADSSTPYSSLVAHDYIFSTTLVAQWSENSYTVRYNTGANDVSPAVIADKTGVRWADGGLVPAQTLTRPGYTFVAWDVTAGGNGDANNTGVSNTATYSELAAADQADISDGVLTLTARWAPKTYTLSFDANGGTPGDTSSKSVTFATAIGALPLTGSAAPSRAGYTFAGWSTTAAGAVDVTEATPYSWASDKTVYAVWNVNGDTPYTTEHYLVGADNKAVLVDTTALTGAASTLAYASPRSFTGYTLDAQYPGTKSEGTIAGDGSLVLSLYYVVNRHDVRYAVIGSIPTGAPAAPVTALNVAYGTPVNVAAPLTLIYYRFSGWTTFDITVTSDSFLMPDKNVIFVGSWMLAPPTDDDDNDGVPNGNEPDYPGYVPPDNGGDNGNNGNDNADNNDDAGTTDRVNSTNNRGASTTVITPGTASTQEVSSETEQTQTGNPLTDAADGNVPLGAVSVTGAWSLVSMLLALAAFIIALIQGMALLAGRQRVGVAFGLALVVCVAGIVVPLVWLASDGLNESVVWINSWTPVVAIALILQIVALVISMVAARRTEQEDDFFDDLLPWDAEGHTRTF